LWERFLTAINSVDLQPWLHPLEKQRDATKKHFRTLTRINRKIAPKTQSHKERLLFEYSFVSWWQKYFAIKCKEFLLNALRMTARNSRQDRIPAFQHPSPPAFYVRVDEMPLLSALPCRHNFMYFLSALR